MKNPLDQIQTFEQLIPFLRDELNWPIEDEDNCTLEELTYEFSPEELGLKASDIPKIREIKQLKPLVTNQPWGVFFVSFDDKSIPISVLKRVLGKLTVDKREQSKKASQKGWNMNDLLFISSFGKTGERELSFLHFSEEQVNEKKLKPVLKELGWDQQDTNLKRDYVLNRLKSKLCWPPKTGDTAAWQKQWTEAFSLTHNQVLNTTKALTKRLAELASRIRVAATEVLEQESNNGPLTKIYGDFKRTIFHNLTKPDFADMYAQTITYGLLSASLARASGALVADDATRMAEVVTHPFLKDMMDTFLAVGGHSSKIDFNELGVNEVVETLKAANMEAVKLDFNNKNPDEDPILHFYEHFLKEYDSIMREQRGVYYTPQPVVSFIVRSVDEILQKEFGLADGLADTATWGDMAKRNPEIKIPKDVKTDEPFVQLLDPATGTGTFLVTAIDLIAERMKSKWRKEGAKDAEIEKRWNEYVPKHLLPRLNGFELMMAPYAIAHIKIGMKLADTGYKPAPGKSPRVHVYLTNTLEEPVSAGASGSQSAMGFITDSLALEAAGADQIKAKAPITVVFGNPPYSGHSMNNKIEWIVEKVKDYRREFPELNKPGQGKWLQDDYVKFIRYSEHRLCGTGAGILGFITNHAYLDNPTFKGMRKRLGEDFEKITVFDLHGNTKRGESAADGTKDENVFAIQQGVCVLAAEINPKRQKEVFRGDLFGTQKQKYKYLSSNTLSKTTLESIQSSAPEWPFEMKDTGVEGEYRAHFSLPSVFSINGDPAPGIVTTHDEFAISWSRDEAIRKVETLCKTRTEAEAREQFSLCTQNQWNYQAAKTALGANDDWKSQITNILYRPFDTRVTIFNSHVAVHRRERVMSHMLAGSNVAISTTRATEIKRGWEHAFVSDQIIQHHTVSLKEVNYLFPLYLHPSATETAIRPNIDPAFTTALQSTTGLSYDDGLTRTQGDLGVVPKKPVQGSMALADPTKFRGDLTRNFTPRDVFDYIYAVLHSPSYRTRYADFLKSDFPRIPLPGSAALFRDLVLLGRQLVPLHLLDTSEAKILQTPVTVFKGQGDNRVEKGFPTYSNGKVMINASQWFEDVTPDVWGFHIGGYQVCEKWLDDRAEKGGKKRARPGRTLSADDVMHYRRITVALKETIRLMAEVDEVVDAHGGWPEAFSGVDVEKEMKVG